MRNIKHQRFGIIFYAPILGGAMFLMTVRLFAYAAFFDSAEFGRLSIGFLVSSTFGMLAGFGSYIDLQRQLPILYRLNKRVSALAFTMNSLILNAVLLVVTLLATPLIYHLVSSAKDTQIEQVIILGAFNGYFQQAFLTLSSESKSRLHLLRYASWNMVRAVCLIGPGIAVAKFHGSAEWVLLAELFSTMVLSFLLLKQQLSFGNMNLRRITRISISGVRQNRISVLLTLSLLSLAASISVSMDRWVSAYVLDVTAFGRLSFALTIILSAVYLQSIINASAFPIFSLIYNERGRDSCWRSVALFSLGLLGFSLISSVAANAALLEIVPVFFPKYDVAINYCGILLVGASFRVADYFSSYLVISGYERSSLISSIVSVVVSIAIVLLISLFWKRNDMELLMATFSATLAASSFIMQFATSGITVLTSIRLKDR